jgi:hypothetical protein
MREEPMRSMLTGALVVFAAFGGILLGLAAPALGQAASVSACLP